ncbi:MAG: transporter substrate-binding domain-containing protein [Ignavibacteria bacterium]|nr:transporter substrate-binding domain-containing protein [Ignavibacteria bacterium]
MKTIKFCSFFIVLAFALAAMSSCNKNEHPVTDYALEMKSMRYLTENYPPFNYEDESNVFGVSVDILNGLFTKMEVNPNEVAIEMLSWETAYERALSQENTMVFSTVRNPERENLFKWVGPIAPQKEIIVALASQHIEITNTTDLATYTIGVINGYSDYTLLINLGVPQNKLIVVEDVNSLYNGLVEGLFDCIAYTEISHLLVLSAMGYNSEDFDVAYTMQVSQLYYAFNLATSDALITYVQSVLDAFKMDKTVDGSSVYEKILNKYNIIQHIEDNITDQMVINLVNSTATMIEENVTTTFADINAGKAPYKDPVNPSLYVFAYDTTVTMVAHATNPLLVGVSFKGKTDVAGKAFRDDMVEGALSEGSGWEDYIYTKPDQSGLYYKTTYYKLTTGSDGKNYIVCAGRYK